MKRVLSLILSACLALSTLCLFGCQSEEANDNENLPTRTVIELTEANLWKYIDVSISGVAKVGSDDSTTCSIRGVLDYALYEDVVITFELVYYTPDQTEDEYGSYTMLIALNAAGDAEFETTHLGTTGVTLGKWHGFNGELVNLRNYNRKINVKSITGKVIYTM